MTSTAVSLSKTTSPALSMVLNRERLFRKLDEDSTRKAVWVFGPPGSGKTTLVASFIEVRNRLSLWYQLDANDADIASFYYYLRQSVLQLKSGSDQPLPELPANVEDWRKYSKQMFRAIFNRVDEPLIIVFDNYESVPPHSDIHQIFRQVIDEIPYGSLLVFISRSSPRPDMARPIANNLISVIDGDDLKLNHEEYVQIAKIRKAELTRETLDYILHSTAGWVTGFIILLELTKRTGHLSKRFGASGNLLFDYVTNEIFSGFDNTEQNILLRICWPRRLNTELAAVISNDKSAGQLLAKLARSNYFVNERVDNQHREYIIHPILREFLQEKAREVFNNKTVEEIQHRTAEQLIGEGQTEEAVELLAGNLDWETLEPLIVAQAPMLIEQGRAVLLASWLEELPHERLNRNPDLLYWYGMARRVHAPREARHYFELAFREFRNTPQPDCHGMALCCCGIIEILLTEMDDFSLLDNWINEASSLVDLSKETDQLHYPEALNIMILTSLMVREPDHERINEWFKRLEKSTRSRAFRQVDCKSMIWLTLAYLLAGELEIAGEILDLLEQSLNEVSDPLLKCQHLLLTAVLHVLSGNGQEGCNAVVECLAIIEENRFNNLLALAYACGSCAALTDNDLEESDNWIEKLESSGSTSHRFSRFLHHYILSWRSLLKEEIINSHHEQRRALNYAVELGMPYFEVLSRTALGQLLYLCEDTRGVNAQLRRVHSIARDIKNPLLEFMTLLVYGDIAIKQGRVTTGTNALRYALGLGRNHAYYHLLWWQPRQLSAVCAVALQHQIETDYVKDFITKRSLIPPAVAIDIPEWPWPYRINIFGGLQIHVNNAEETDITKSQGRPSQLLKVLIALGGNEVNANNVAETLWPHVDREYGNKSLTINLHRLRRIFGNDEAIILNEGRLSINPELIWLDTWSLEHHLAGIESTITMPGYVADENTVNNLFGRLTEIYQGPFLNEEVDYACYTAAREHFRFEFNKGVGNLIDVISRFNLPCNIPDLYNQAIRRDPSAEAIYRRLMLWYLEADRYVEAMEIYKRCCSAMARTVQQVPSAETQSIYNKLIKLAG